MEKELFAAVMTGKGTGAISTVQVFGENSESVIKEIFKPASEKHLRYESGEILLGTIHDGPKTIDQVTIGCEADSSFAIHCHGNPLVAELIIKLLRKHKIKILTDEQLQIKILSVQKQNDAIAQEAMTVQAQAKTLEGTKIVLNQVDYGLGKEAREWLRDIDTIPISSFHKQVEDILSNSAIAKLIIFGCKIILTGPPNTGKSSLLNCLAGKQKSIVTDISGTTRDWVTANCKIESMSLELIDTAGLDDNLLVQSDNIDNTAQKKSLELIGQADLILLVLDNSRDIEFDYGIFNDFTGKRIITVLNKSDLLPKFNTNKLPSFLSNYVKISAKEQTGIDNLISSIRQTCNVADFDPRSPICFTDRQKKLLEELKSSTSKKKNRVIMSKLLKQIKD
ncbi:MAG: 50S ribosome-binding GTPase [Sedimentisphaerales bacterium]|nr:50S ribosome-binding GTPase [Sedimentisphaerales bacterium]